MVLGPTARSRQPSPTPDDVTPDLAVDEAAGADEVADVVADDDEAPDREAAATWSGWLDRLRSHPAEVVLGASIVVWCIVFGRLIWQRHARFATFDFDLGHHDQAIWLLSQGKGFITVSGMPVFGHHLTLAYLAVVPLYWLGGGPQLLDLLQTAALGLSAVPIFLYARDRLGNSWQALAIGVAWLLNPSVQWLCWEAWHPETMAIPFLLTAYLLATRRQWRWYWVALVAALSWKEDVAIAVAILGIVFAIRGERRIGLATLALGVAWFLVAYGVVMPHFNGGTNQAGIFYGALGNSPGDLVRTTLTDPTLVIDRLRDNDALGYARDLLAPFGFLPLLAPALLAVAAPQFFANILTNANFFYDIRFHYTAIILAMLALATVEGVARLRLGGLRRFGVGLVAASALATSVAWGVSPLSTDYRIGYWPLQGNARQDVLDDAVASVPDDAAVAATYYIVPHLSHRDQIYTFPNPWIPANWGVGGVAPHDPDSDHQPAEVEWLVIDRTTHAPGSREELLLDDLLTNGEFEVVSDREGVVVARRVAPPRRRRNLDLGALGLDIETHRAQMAGGDRSRPDRRGLVGRVSVRRAEIVGQRGQDTVHEPAAVVGREALGELDRLVDDHGHRDVGSLGELVGPQAQHVEVEHGHPLERPARGPGSDRLVEAGPVLVDAADQQGRHLVRFDDLQVESVARRDPFGLRLVEQVQRPLAGVGAAIGTLRRMVRRHHTRVM